MTHFAITVVSDTVCPWCYVGKIKLDAGITAYKKAHPTSPDIFAITWMPYFLNPTASKTGIDKRAYYNERFGPEKAQLMQDRLLAVGRDVGINFKYGGKTGHSGDSHRLIQLAKTKGPAVQTAVVNALFKSYFENEGDITSHAMLTQAGVSGGLDETEVTQWLESDQGGAQVDKEVKEAKMRGVSGVPNFILQGKYEIGGAQEAESFVRVFERIKQMEG